MHSAHVRALRFLLPFAAAGCGGVTEAPTSTSAGLSATSQVCQAIESFVAEPLASPVGTPFALTASPRDPKAIPIAYAWSSPWGRFDSPTSATTHFTCTYVGDAVVTLKLTDGDCVESATIHLMCDPAPGSEGGVAACCPYPGGDL